MERSEIREPPRTRGGPALRCAPCGLRSSRETDMNRLMLALAAVLLAALPAAGDELAPTGTLRATFIATNPVQAITDPKTGEVRGPAADLTSQLARRLGVAYTIKGVPGVQAVIDSVK